MIDLDNHRSAIEEFIQNSIEQFRIQNGEEAKIVGVYCCPWAGWLTTNFNIHKTLKEANNNCTEFEFVEFKVLELDGWQQEYETDRPIFKTGKLTINADDILDNEKFNEMVFKYLRPIVLKLKANNRSHFLLQMLDSRFVQLY